MFEKYRVKGNETIEDIAKKYHTNASYIQDLNNLSFGEMLREGMDIIVPQNKENILIPTLLIVVIHYMV